MKLFKRNLILVSGLLLLVAVLSSTPVWALKGKLMTLDNGLRVFVKKDTSSPVVAINIWTKVGSVNEEPGEEGYAHLIEHMMFKGTPTHPYGTLDNEIKKMGATQNAFTSKDYTCYYVVGAKEHFNRLMELEADAVLNSSFEVKELEKEKQVVIEEIRMSVDSPNSRIYSMISDAAYKVHPYKHPILGPKKNIEQVTREKLYGFYKKFYVSSNMWVVIVGDIEPSEAFASVKKYMGQAPKVAKPLQKISMEPVQLRQGEKVEYAEIQNAYTRMAWHVPGIRSPDRFALSVISRILGSGKTSWLWKALVEEEQVAFAAVSGYYASLYPTLFQVAGVTTQGNVRKFISLANKIVARLKKGEVTQEELDKAKQKIIADSIFGNETAEDQAQNYGHYAVIGNIEDAETYVEQIRAVSLEQIQQVAKKYFNDGNLSVARLEPELAEGGSKPVMLTLDNGIRMILKENHSSPLVSMSIQVAAGGLMEDKKEAGLANLTAEMLDRGTKELSAEEIAEKFEAMGTRKGISASKSFVELEMQSLSENFLPSLELFLELMHDPSFPEEELDKTKKQVLASIKNNEDDLFYSTLYATLDKLYPKSPIAYSSDGKADDVKKLRRSELKAFHKKYYVGSNMVVAIVGDFYIKELKEKLVKAFGVFKEGREAKFSKPKVKKIKEPIEVTLKKNRAQAQIIYAARTFPNNDKKSPAMSILQTILSGSMSSRLFKNLRAKDSLAYATWASNTGLKNAGYFYATLSTAPSKVASATIRLKEELDSIKEKGFTKEEFEDAKKYIIGQYALARVDNLSLAGDYASNEFMDKGFDYYEKYSKKIASTTVEEVKKVADEYLLASGSYVLTITKP
jgi:zinc protease